MGDFLQLLRESEGTRAWFSFSCRDGEHISDGTPIRECAALFENDPQVVAVGVNCTAPRLMSSLIAEVRRGAPTQSIVAYPNSGETYSAEDNAWFGTVTPGDCASAARAWINAGAKIVGGCCRMGPEHIRAMRRALT